MMKIYWKVIMNQKSYTDESGLLPDDRVYQVTLVCDEHPEALPADWDWLHKSKYLATAACHEIGGSLVWWSDDYNARPVKIMAAIGDDQEVFFADADSVNFLPRECKEYVPVITHGSRVEFCDPETGTACKDFLEMYRNQLDTRDNVPFTERDYS